MKLSELIQKRQDDIIDDAKDDILMAEIDDWTRRAAKLEARAESLDSLALVEKVRGDELEAENEAWKRAGADAVKQLGSIIGLSGITALLTE